MKKTLVLVLLILLAIPLVANADGADIWHEQDTIPFSTDITGCGTTVHVEGVLKRHWQTVITPDGYLLEALHFSTHGLQGTDSEGNVYRGVKLTNLQILDETATSSQRFLLIGQGSAPNIMIVLMYHEQLRDHGNAYVTIDSFECR